MPDVTNHTSGIEQYPVPPKFLLWNKSSIAIEVKVACFFCFVLFIIRFPVLGVIDTHFLGGIEQDAGLYSWLVRSNTRDLFELGWFNTKAFFPYTRTLAWSDNFLLPSLFCSILLHLGASLALAYNIVVLGAQFLNGYCTYRLAFRLSGERVGSVVAGLAFMTSAYLAGHMGHPQLQFAFWLPVGLSAAFYSLLARSVLSGVILGIVICGAFLTTVYYSLFLIVIFPLIFLSCKILRPHHLRILEFSRVIFGGLIGILPLVFFLQPYFDVRATFGSRALYEARAFGATALSYISAPPLSLLYSKTALLTHLEATFFPGFGLFILGIIAFRRLTETTHMRRVSRCVFGTLLLTVAFSSIAALKGSSQAASPFYSYLTGVAVWLLLVSAVMFLYRLGSLERRLGAYYFTDRSIIATLLFLGIAAFAISLGPLGVNTMDSFSPGPFTVLYGIVPGMNSLRAISRIGIIVQLTLSLLIPFSIGLLRKKRNWGMGFVVALVGIITAENWQTTFAREELSTTPAAFEAISEARGKEKGISPDALIALPMTEHLKADHTVESWGNFAKLNVRAMHWSFPLQMNTVNGYSGQRSSIMKEFPGHLANFPDQTAINTLEQIPNLRYVVYLPEYSSEFSQVEFELEAKRYENHLTLLKSDAKDGYLFEFHPTTWVTDDFVLRVPSFPVQQVTLELKAFGASEELEVALHLKKHFDRTPFALLKVKPDNQWHEHTVVMPETSDRVRPLLLTLKTPESAKVYLRGRHSADLRVSP